jgi:DNA polymerase/3'-5' exonuclease PolX
VTATVTRTPLAQADAIAAEVVAQLAPHCDRLEVAGSVRRRRSTVGDLEVVCVPKPYEPSPLFASGIALVVNQWEKVRGELPCRYTRRILPSGLPLDLFMVDPDGFGLQLAIRTGSADWSRRILASAWVRAGFHSEGGLLRDQWGGVHPAPTEQALFDLIGLPWVDPTAREVQP